MNTKRFSMYIETVGREKRPNAQIRKAIAETRLSTSSPGLRECVSVREGMSK